MAPGQTGAILDVRGYKQKDLVFAFAGKRKPEIISVNRQKKAEFHGKGYAVYVRRNGTIQIDVDYPICCTAFLKKG